MRIGQQKVDAGYVSEFTNFMNHFLEEHPEELEEQRAGRLLYWDRKVNLAGQEKAKQDSVPDDRYGFDYSAWHGTVAGGNRQDFAISRRKINKQEI